MFWKSRFFKSLLWLPILFIVWIVLIGSDDRPGFLRAKAFPFIRSLGVSGGSATINAYENWVFENTPTGAGGTDSSFTSARIDTLTLGNDTDDVDGWMIWIDADGGTGNVLMASDGLTFSGFSGGVDIDGAFTAGTITSDATVIAETGMTINPVVADQETPSLVIGADGDSDNGVISDKSLTIFPVQAGNPTAMDWKFSVTGGTGAGGFIFELPSASATIGFHPALAQIVLDMGDDLIDLDAFLIQTGSADGKIDMDEGAQGTFTVGDDGDVDIFEVNGLLQYNPNALSNAGTSVADDAAITVTYTIMRMVGADADAVLDQDPAIVDGTVDGQIVIIQGTADGNTVTIADNVNTQLDGGANVTLGDGDVICLMWDSNYSMWIEQYRSNN